MRNKIKVCFITEGNAEIGFGHISRCISLYQAFKEKNITAYFIVNGDSTIKQLLDVKKHYIFDWIKYNDKLFEKIKKADIAIIDSYLADLSLYKQISQKVKVSVYIDDALRLDYPPGVVINSSITQNNFKNLNKQDVIYLVGSEYFMLKKGFWSISTKKVNENLNFIMITFGGSDDTNFTPRILKKIKETFPNLKLNVIIGKGFQNISDIESFIDKNCKLIYYPTADEMKKVMIKSDIAITAGGQTMHELASVGVPSVIVATAENQIINAKPYSELGINFYAGWWEDKKIFDNIINFVIKLKNINLKNRASI